MCRQIKSQYKQTLFHKQVLNITEHTYIAKTEVKATLRNICVFMWAQISTFFMLRFKTCHMYIYM